MAKKIERYKTNPFLSELSLSLSTKNVKIMKIGTEENILINQKTGEIAATHVVAQKRVDSERFIKTFADYMSFTFELTKAGNKALRVVMWSLQEQAINKDEVALDKYSLEDFLQKHGIEFKSLSYPTFARGLGELCKAKIIAKTQRSGRYFINPTCIFNGDRVAFTTVIEREIKSNDEVERDRLEKNGQQRID